MFGGGLTDQHNSTLFFVELSKIVLNQQIKLLIKSILLLFCLSD